MIQKIQQAVKEITGIDPAKKSRKKEVVQTRALFCKACKDLLKVPELEISKFLGIDHTNIKNYREHDFYIDYPECKYYGRYKSILEEIKFLLDPIYRTSVLNMSRILHEELKAQMEKISQLEKTIQTYKRLHNSNVMNRLVGVQQPVFYRAEDAIEEVLRKTRINFN